MDYGTESIFSGYNITIIGLVLYSYRYEPRVGSSSGSGQVFFELLSIG